MPNWTHEIIDPETGQTKTMVRVWPMRNLVTGEVEYWDGDRAWSKNDDYAFILSDDDHFREIDDGKRDR
jgi:hypothetical protein